MHLVLLYYVESFDVFSFVFSRFFFSKKCEKWSMRVHLKFKFFRKKAIKENIVLSLS